jgi:uncharacterized protein involved in type VI secretion and phage assembly
MDGARRRAVFAEQSTSDIIGSIVRSHPVTVGTIESIDAQQTWACQYDQTDFEFVMYWASASGKFAHYNGQEFRVVTASSDASHDLIWRQTLGRFQLRLGTAGANYRSATYNYEQTETYEQDTDSLSDRAALSNLSRISPEASSEVYHGAGFAPSGGRTRDARSLDQRLINERSSALGRMIRCEGNSIVPALTVGACAQIQGMGGLDGQYYITAVRHVINDSGKYHNVFVGTPLDTAFPQQRWARSSATRIQSAVVVDNNDPEKLGRVQVKFPWLSGTPTYWSRVSQVHAGGDHGQYWLPEVNDEVLVAFEHGDADYPVVIGQMYNSTDKPNDAFPDDQNNKKAILTRSGHQILFDDTSGSESIQITNKDGDNKIILDVAGPGITIETKGSVSIKGGNVAIEAEQELTLKSGTNMKLEAGANYECKASGMFKAEGANMDIKGQGPVVIKGAIINLN